MHLTVCSEVGYSVDLQSVIKYIPKDLNRQNDLEVISCSLSLHPKDYWRRLQPSVIIGFLALLNLKMATTETKDSSVGEM